MRPRSTGLPWAMALATLLLAASADAKSHKPPLCTGGRFLIAGEALVAGDATPGHEPIVLGASRVAVGSVCPAAKAKLKATKAGTKLAVTWPACQGVHGHVKMVATLPADCASIAGTLTARKAKLREPFSATLSRCDDGTVDGGAGEECDPPSADSCDASCRAIVARAVIGAAGGSITSADGLFTLDIPPGALASDTAITIHKLQPDEFPQELVDAGADAAYGLGPNGLQFAVPATATLRLGDAKVAADDSVSANLVELLTTTAGGNAPEPLAGQQTLLDAEANVTTVIGKLVHFSDVIASMVFKGVTFSAKIKFIPDPVCVGQPFVVDVTVTASQAFLLQDVEIDHTNRTDPTDLVQYAGPTQVKVATLKSGRKIAEGQVSKYSCTEAGTGIYEADVTIVGFGTIHVKAPLTCVDCTSTTTTTRPSPVTTTTRTTTTTSRTSTVTASTAATSTSETSTTSTSTTTTATTTSSTTTTTIAPPPTPGCCNCGDGSCFSGANVSPDTCDLCTGGPGTFIPNAECPTASNMPGRCMRITTTTTPSTSTSLPVVTSTTVASTTTIAPPTTSSTSSTSSSVPVVTSTTVSSTTTIAPPTSTTTSTSTTTTSPGGGTTTTTTVPPTLLRVDVQNSGNSCGGTDLTNPAATPPFGGVGLAGKSVINLGKGCTYFGDGSSAFPFRPRYGAWSFFGQVRYDGTLWPDTTRGVFGCSRGAGSGMHCLNGSTGNGGGQCNSSNDCHQPCVQGICNNSPGKTCTKDADCAAVPIPPDVCAPDVNCLFGGPVVVPNLITPTPQGCIMTYFETDLGGRVDLTQGLLSIDTTLAVDVSLGVCPFCGSLGTCSGGAHAGGSCTSVLDCPPSNHLVRFMLPVHLRTQASTLGADASGSFCPGSGRGAFGNANLTQLLTAGMPTAGPIVSTPKSAMLGDVGCGPAGLYWTAFGVNISATPLP